MTIKNILNQTLQSFLEPVREIRSNLKKDELMDKLFYGTKVAKNLVMNKMLEIRDVIGIKYNR